jgi:hypothetical protein
MRDNLELFKELYPQNKEKLLYDLRSAFEEYGNDGSFPDSKRTLLFGFIKKIEDTQLPKCDDWWYYSYRFTRLGIALEMCHGTDFSAENEHEWIMATDETFLLLEVNCPMITVKEYAELHEVEPVAVRQWIRRGKLRAIKKQGRDWLVSSIAEKPSRNYKPVTYSWSYIDSALYEDFPYLKGVYSIDIYQSDDNKAMFVVESDLGNEILISSEERERLELALLAIDDVDAEEFVK